MNKRSILVAGITAALTLGTATATAAFVDFTRSGNKAGTLPGRRATTTFLTIDPTAMQFRQIAAPVAAEAQSDAVMLLTDFPTMADDVTNAPKTMPESGKITWKGYNQGDIEYNYVFSARCEQGYDKDLRTRDTWIYFPVSVTEADASMTLSYGVSTNINPAKTFTGSFELCLTSAAAPESVVATIHSVDDFSTAGGNLRDFTYFSDLGFKGPATPGEYYLAIHVRDCKPKTAGGSLGLYDYANFNFGKINLSQKAASGPTVGPNGELFTMHPTEEEFNACTVIDGNGDGAKPVYYYAESGDKVYDWPIYYNNQDAATDADEWIITPAVRLSDPTVIYTASIDAYATGSYTTEAFDIRIGNGTDPAEMTRVILDEPAVTNNSWQKFTSRFGVAEAGDYHFAIHIKSLKSKGWRIVMKDFEVCVTEASSLVPASCPEMTAVADPTGALKATVSVKLPDHYMNLAAIPASEKVTVTLASPAGTAVASGTPGQTVSAVIDAVDGANIISAITSNANGTGGESKTVVACGIDTPSNPVVKSQVSDDNMTLTLTWESPATGLNGGVVNPATLVYRLYIYQQTETATGWALIQDNITDTGITLKAPTETQSLYDFMISASNDKGESPGGLESYCSVVLGKPYAMPMADSFTNGTVLAGINITYPTEEYYGQWALDDPGKLSDDSACPDSYALIFVPTNEGGDRGMFHTPKFSTRGVSNVRVKARVYCYGNMASADLYAVDIDGTRTRLGKISAADGAGWVNATFDLPASLENKPVLYLTFDVYAPNKQAYFMLDEYEVYHRLENDLALSNLQAPTYVTLGNELAVTADITNRGFKAATLPEVTATVYDGTAAIATATLTATESTLQPDGKTSVSGKFSFNKADFAGRSYTLHVTLGTNDDDPANDSANLTFSVGLPGGPVITDLKGRVAADGKGLELTWSDPYADGYVENFESYPSGCYSTMLGPWKNIDFDRQYTYSLGSYPVVDPGMPKAFQIINLVDAELKGGLDIPSGDQFICAMSVAEGESDDWLISPEVKGGSKVSFYITAVSDSYTEPVDLLYSTTDSDPDSFTTLKTLSLTAAGWEYMEFVLPADARHFAFRYYGNDAFGIFIDDVCYRPVTPEVEVTGYRVYRNDKVVKTGLASTSYVDTDVNPELSYTYNVSTLALTGGEEIEYPLSNTVELSLSAIGEVGATRATVSGGKGTLTITGATGHKAEVFNASGMTVYSDASLAESVSLSLRSGIYIVRIGTETCKVTVY